MTDSLFPDLFAAPPATGSTQRSGQGPSRPVSEEALLDGLNPPQREAVLHAGSPVLVVAGDALRRPYDIALGRVGLSHAFVPAMDASLHGIRALIGA